VTHSADDIPADPAIVVANPYEDVTVENFIAWLDDRQKGSPITTSVSAAETHTVGDTVERGLKA
jgi:hypothetical protein